MIPASFTIKAKDKAKQNPKLLLGVLILVHLIVISLNRIPGQPDVRYLHTVALTVAWPFQWVTSHSVAAVKSTVSHYFYLRDKTQESEFLKARNAELEARVVELNEKVKLFDQINAINQSKPLSDYPKIVASVIGRDSKPWFNTIVIDRGTLSGVTRNQPVVTAERGLVGRVIQTSPVSARVLLITDERHGAGAMIAQNGAGGMIAQTTFTRTLGVIKGQNAARCLINFSELPEKLTVGEPVITSGQDRLYPKGLLIGRIVNIDPSGKVEVAPAAPLTALETVAVLTISSDEIYRQFDELIKEEQREKEKQEKTPDRRRREAGR